MAKDKSSFVCYKCNTKTFFNPDDYNDLSAGQLLIEMKIMGDFEEKPKKVMIRCDNPKCRVENIVTIK